MADEPGAVRLNLGAGDIDVPGFRSLDAKTNDSIYPLPYADGTVDEIRASHVLEHFSHREVQAVVADWARALKPGGILRIAVPDFAAVARRYFDPQDQSPIQGFVMGGQTDADDFHRAIFDFDTLSAVLDGAGLERIERWESEVRDCASYAISLNLQARKPYATQLEGVGAVMSMPRLAFTENMFCAIRSLMPLNVPLSKVTGAFWGQSLTTAIEQQMAAGARYVLTLDYDTVFERSDVVELYRLMESHPDVGAICPVQMRRVGKTPLLTIRGPDGKNLRRVPAETFEQDVVPVNSGHFGLSMLRTSALRKMPKPWFRAKPDRTGSWGPDRVDEDVAFWHSWNEHRLNLCVAPGVRVGHIEMAVLWPKPDLTQHVQMLREYETDGRPMETF